MLRGSFTVVIAASLLALVSEGCASKSAEGESCELANGDDDCESGLVCRASFEVAASESVCCPRPPARPGSKACGPAISDFEPDPTVDAATVPSSGGSGGTGGTGGSGGVSGDAGDGAASDAMAEGGDATPDASGGDASTSDAGDASGD